MPGIKIRAQVLLCPHQSHLTAGSPGPSWPRPVGMQVQLTPVGSGTTNPISLGETNDQGITALSPELEHDIYRVIVPGFEAADLDLTSIATRKTLDITLAPNDDRWLMPLQLTEEPAGGPVVGASVQINSSGGAFKETFISNAHGYVYAAVPAGDGTINFESVPTPGGGSLIPSDPAVEYTAGTSSVVNVILVPYWPAIQISVKATVTMPDGSTASLTDTSVTVEYRGSPRVPSSMKIQSVGSSGIVAFDSASPGVYAVTVFPPPSFSGLPIKNAQPQVTTKVLSSGDRLPVSAQFAVVDTEDAQFVVTTPQGQPLTSGFMLQIVGPDNTVDIVRSVTPANTSFTVTVPKDETLVFRFDPDDPTAVPKIGNIPLTMSASEQNVAGPPGTNTIELKYEYSITGQAVDEHGQAVPGAVVEILDQNQTHVDFVVADQQGSFYLGLETSGTYYVAQYPEGEQVGIRERVDVNSNCSTLVQVKRGTGGGGGGGTSGEALTDLSAYPLLTEEITTTGAPAPATGGPGVGGPGAGYGQAVDQVMRDVLGWRPTGDVAGFQAALAGAFQLREAEGHTEWSWQQRGYAVQADMGALTGAQASIYARAKSALDQILPLLTSLTPINPALYPPQDLEAIRTVVAAELQELVNELALEGGPRIQRVDELFRLLTGESRKSLNPDPNAVQGQLGTLRDRFGLTVAYVDTVDEERIVTNFRIVVEQVLTLQESWESDRRLLSVLDSSTSLGTILIWLSRGLEAVCESVDDLTFALDSVFVDAAQRQVIQLDFTGETVELPELPLRKGKKAQYPFKGKQPPILLSDLLDWVVRASRDEGPRIVQDAGKDGVLAFAPVLNELRILIHATRRFTHSPRGATLPDGMRTPRVRRALEVLAGQLDEAADLAALVKRDGIPEITGSSVNFDSAGQMAVTLTGNNFRRHSSVFLYAANREDIADMPARHVKFEGPTTILARFRTPRREDPGGRLNWQVVLTNEDGTTSDPVPITIPRQSDLDSQLS
jgi:hypothetical protein